MEYIHVKKIGDKKYYSLMISVRKCGRVITKDMCNLGSNFSKDKYKRFGKKYKEKIRKSYKTIKRFLETNHYLEKARKLKMREDKHLDRERVISVESMLLHYRSRFLELDSLTKKEVLDNFAIKTNYLFHAFSI